LCAISVAFRKRRLYRWRMRPPACWIVLLAMAFTGCTPAHKVVRAVTAPVRYVFNEPPPENPAASDVTTSGHPVAARTPRSDAAARPSSETASSATGPTSESRVAKTKPSSSAQTSGAAIQFPVAKPVPGKPGIVFNPFDPHGSYIDVTGYASGSIVKDPESQKIFVVP
jgi:hypothetical protein